MHVAPPYSKRELKTKRKLLNIGNSIGKRIEIELMQEEEYVECMKVLLKTYIKRSL
jgi:hypothetical protein